MTENAPEQVSDTTRPAFGFALAQRRRGWHAFAAEAARMDILSQPIATIAAALIAAFLGSLLGARTALARFQRERVFDRQLEWYERGVRAVNGLAEALSVALVFEGEGRGEHQYWVNVQLRHLDVTRFANEAPIFATAAALDAAESARRVANEGAQVSNIYEPGQLPEPHRTEAITKLSPYEARLNAAARAIAAEARRHLGLPPLAAGEIGSAPTPSLEHQGTSG